MLCQVAVTMTGMSAVIRAKHEGNVISLRVNDEFVLRIAVYQHTQGRNISDNV